MAAPELPQRRRGAKRSARAANSAGSAKVEHVPSKPPRPTHRTLRGYAFDPGLASTLDTAVVSQVVYKVPWEDLPDGPRGEYVEVVDFDPASRCFYAPVDLDAPMLLAQDGLAPSEGNPQFHQQMVYAVAMTTIDRFELALGRKAMWAARDRDDAFVQRLRIYPHALREANAYYSPDKKALLFGYFPATTDKSSGQFPGGMVFTCLSHDVVAHEMTHALLDGFHEHFLEPTNPDVLAFHEAFADIVALFQHFTFPELLRHEIAKTRGDLGTENLLAQMATQFGHAQGTHGALRDAIGRFDKAQGKWIPHDVDPTELDRTVEPHDRGAILVAAVFDAFLIIYRHRTRGLLRLATGGTGELPKGDLPPDLADRLAETASTVAGQVLNMCIRALDYCPPVDLAFGEFLRALITADLDLVPDDPFGYRVAFVEAFRRRGIYPENVRTLSEDGLCWHRPEADTAFAPGEIAALLEPLFDDLGDVVYGLRNQKSRRGIWDATRSVRREIHRVILEHVMKSNALDRLTGLALTERPTPKGVKVRRDGTPVFQVHAFRESRRQRDDGRALNQAFITILQKETVEVDDEVHTVRYGSTLILDLDEKRVRYVIRKGQRDKNRWKRMQRFLSGEHPASLAATYFGDATEPFAGLHRRDL